MDQGEANQKYICKPFSSPPITTFDDARLFWHNGEPRHKIFDSKKSIEIEPTEKLDYWSKTFYGPKPLIINNGQTLVAKIPWEEEATITTSFTLKPKEQFDQAGIMVIVNENVWVKAGIEYTDGFPNLSCVVTNDGYSDWSTQRIPRYKSSENDQEDLDRISLNVRLSKLRPGAIQGPSLIFEAAYVNKDVGKNGGDLDWFQVRIASLRSVAEVQGKDDDWLMGVFSNAPVKQGGSSVTFHSIEIGEKVKPVHDAVL